MMFTAILVTSLTCPGPAAAALPPAPAPFIVQADDVDAKISALGEDVDKLLALADDYKEGKDRASAKRVFERVIELDSDNEVARKGLRHQRYDGRWFTSYVELSKYKREEAAAMKAKGLAKLGDEWVPEADLPFLNMGWTRAADGTWNNPVDVQRAKQIAEWKKSGYQFRADDNSWVAPGDIEKWTNVLFRCGEEWLDLEKADAYHSKIETAWELAGEHFDVTTTCAWNVGNSARWYADRTYADLVRLFGVEPTKRPRIAVLRSVAEYNELAGTRPVFNESEGFSSLYGAYFAEATFDTRTQPIQYAGCGVTYWAEGWGPYWARWSAAQSFVDAIDPSWIAIGNAIAAGENADGANLGATFWAEKKIPRWLRYGAASYVDRFMKNPEAAEGADPWDIRTFAFGQVKKAGGMHSLDEVFAFGLSLEDQDKSRRLYHEAGLVVAYLLDGAEGDTRLTALHDDFKNALQAGDGDKVREAANLLETELKKHEDQIKAFAGL